RLERVALARLVTHKISRLDIKPVIDNHEPARALHHLALPAWSEIAQHCGSKNVNASTPSRASICRSAPTVSIISFTSTCVKTENARMKSNFTPPQSGIDKLRMPCGLYCEL